MSKKKAKEVDFDQEMKEPMSLTVKLVLAALAIVVVVAVIYLAYYLIHYNGYKGYEKYLSDYSYEEGTEFSPAQDSSVNVAGYTLVAENDKIKLYTDTATGFVAIYDKRDGKTIYSNPQKADEDELANNTIKNYMKSAFILEYYNADVQTGNYDSYSKSVAMGGLSYEGIKDGIRYIYDIGESGITFKIPIEYRLNDDSVDVSVPVKGIEETGNGYVYKIQLLRYFGAADSEETGYHVVPNDSGSLINFNNGKTTVGQYSQYIYDIDPLVSTFTTQEETGTAKLPIFALCRDDYSILASVEDGTTTARITAAVAGSLCSYNYAYSTFTLRNADDLSAFGGSDSVMVMEPDMYDINCTVKYTKLTSDYKGYAGVANYYRERLINEGVLSASASKGDIPFYYDVIGGVQETTHVVGVQHLSTFAMTTFDEAADMAKDLKASGINNQVMNYGGWMNRGYQHDAVDKIRLLSKAGSKSDMEALSDTLSEVGGKLYLDTAMIKVPKSDKGFNETAMGSRYYGGGYVVSFGLVNPTTLRSTANLGYTSNRYTVLSPKYLPRFADGLVKKVGSYDVSGISLRDLGNYVASDKKRTNIIDREQALDIVLGQWDKLEALDKNLCADEPNAYVFGYLDDILNAPTTGNDFYIIDENIPLYEMIIHGSIDYSSGLLNFYDMADMTPKVLELIEYGAAPHYIFTKEETSRMKETAMNRFYATTYDTWKDEAVSVYNQVNDALKYVSDAQIVDHIIDGDLRKVTYSNGVSIYLNYGSEEQSLDGVSIPALSYRMEGI